MRVLSVDLGSSSVKWAVVDTATRRILGRGQVACPQGSLRAEVDITRQAVQAAATVHRAEAWTLTGQTTSYVLCTRDRRPLMAMFWYTMLADPGCIAGSLEAEAAAILAAGGSDLVLWSLRDYVLAELTGLAADHTDPSECSALPLGVEDAQWLARYQRSVPPWERLGTTAMAGQSFEVYPGANDVVADACYALEMGCRRLVRVGTSTVVARIGGGAPHSDSGRLSAHEIWGGVAVHHGSIASSLGGLFAQEVAPAEVPPGSDRVRFAYDVERGTWSIIGIGAQTTSALVAAGACRALAMEIKRQVTEVGGSEEEEPWVLMGGGMSDSLALALDQVGAVPRERARRTEIPGWEAVVGVALLMDPNWRERQGIGKGPG